MLRFVHEKHEDVQLVSCKTQVEQRKASKSSKATEKKRRPAKAEDNYKVSRLSSKLWITYFWGQMILSLHIIRRVISVDGSFATMPSRGTLSSASKFDWELLMNSDTYHHIWEEIKTCNSKWWDSLIRAKTTRMATSPPKDVEALAKLQARTKYNPSEVAKSKSSHIDYLWTIWALAKLNQAQPIQGCAN